MFRQLLLLPQRYIFSSKSQQKQNELLGEQSCCCYHKGTYFQANHNSHKAIQNSVRVVVATTKVHIFKQITTLGINKKRYSQLLLLPQRYIFSSKSQLDPLNTNRVSGCCCYHKGTYFQANHNPAFDALVSGQVVVATTKVHIFKQITTRKASQSYSPWLLLLPQRYIFSSKSQLLALIPYLIYSCCCYHKGTYFQANHNS